MHFKVYIMWSKGTVLENSINQCKLEGFINLGFSSNKHKKINDPQVSCCLAVFFQQLVDNFSLYCDVTDNISDVQ